MAGKIPATVITGFLGAGKTTLVQHMLANANGKRIALIINEFGDLGVDGDLLKGCGIEGCSDDDVVELSNGCICCTVAEDFVPAIEKLLGRENPPDHIVIETSGLALPQPLVRAFNWPEIRSKVTVDGVVTVVDSEAVNAGRFAHDVSAVDAQRATDEMLDHETPLSELFEDQLACADMIILNKSDLLSTKQADDWKPTCGQACAPAFSLSAPRWGLLARAHCLVWGLVPKTTFRPATKYTITTMITTTMKITIITTTNIVTMSSKPFRFHVVRLMMSKVLLNLSVGQSGKTTFCASKGLHKLVINRCALLFRRWAQGSKPILTAR